MDHPFPYLKSVAARFGVDDLQVTDPLRRGRDSQEVVEDLTPVEMTELARAYREIVRRGDAGRIRDWLGQPEESSRVEPRQLWLLLVLFELLGDRGLPPFSDRQVKWESPPRPKPDWTRLPPPLQRIASAAEKYGDLNAHGKIEEFLRAIDNADLTAMHSAASLCEAMAKEVWHYIDAHPIDEFRESAQLWELMTFFDNGNVQEILKHSRPVLDLPRDPQPPP